MAPGESLLEGVIRAAARQDAAGTPCVGHRLVTESGAHGDEDGHAMNNTAVFSQVSDTLGHSASRSGTPSCSWNPC